MAIPIKECDWKKWKIFAIKSTNIKNIELEAEDCKRKIKKYMKLMFKKVK